MKKLLFLLLFPSLLFAQTEVQRASSPAVQVDDQRARFWLNMVPPDYADTTAANTSKGLDYIGAIIHTHTPATLYFRDTSAGTHKWTLVAVGTVNPIWGLITGTLSAQTDLQAALNAKQATIALGTTAQYFRGDLSLATFPTDLASFSNGPGYLLSITTTNSVTGNGTSGTPAKLVNDAASPGANKVYGTDGGGVKGWFTGVSGGGNLDATLALAGRLLANYTSEWANRTVTWDSATMILKNTGNNPAFQSSYIGSLPGTGYYPFQINPVLPAETSQIPWMITRINSAQSGHDGNEVVNMGFNVGPAAVPASSGKPAMFWSMESNYIPGATLMEWHQEFANTAGTIWRLSSYTINGITSIAATLDIDYYLTVSRLYIKSPTTGSVVWKVGDFNNSASASMQLSTSAWTSTYLMNTSGLNIADGGGVGAGRSFSATGFQFYQFGSNNQLVINDGTTTIMRSMDPATLPTLNIQDNASHSTYLYNPGATGSLTMGNKFLGSGSPQFNVLNTVAANFSGVTASNDGSDQAYMLVGGTTMTTSGLWTAGMAWLRGYAANGLLISTDQNSTAPIIFGLGGGAGGKMFGATQNFAWGTTTDVATALFQLSSTTKGFLPPRMTTTQKNAISSPAEGLIVYDVTLHKAYGYDGSAWQALW